MGILNKNPLQQLPIRAELLPRASQAGQTLTSEQAAAMEGYRAAVQGAGGLPNGSNLLSSAGDYSSANPWDLIYRGSDVGSGEAIPKWLKDLGAVSGPGALAFGNTGFQTYRPDGTLDYVYSANKNDLGVVDPSSLTRVSAHDPLINEYLNGRAKGSSLNGLSYDVLDRSGNVIRQDKYHDVRDAGFDWDAVVPIIAASIATMGAASAAAAGSAGGAAGGAAGGGGAAAGGAGAVGGFDAATAAELAASNVIPASSGAFIPATAAEMGSMGGLGAAGAGGVGTAAMGAGGAGGGAGGAAGSGVTDLGGGLTMGADGQIIGGTGAFTPATASEMAAMGVPAASGGLLSTLGKAAGALTGSGGTGEFDATKLIGPGLQAIGGIAGVNAASSAADAQLQATRDAQAKLEPWYRNGELGLNALATELGLGPNTGAANYGRSARDFGMADFNADPGYAFRQQQGEQGLQRAASASGGLGSGKFLKDAMGFNQGLASQEFNNSFNRFQTTRTNRLNPLQSLAGLGQTAASTISDLSTQGGNAIAAGKIGQTNALTNAIGQGFSMYQNQNQMDQNNMLMGALLRR